MHFLQVVDSVVSCSIEWGGNPMSDANNAPSIPTPHPSLLTCREQAALARERAHRLVTILERQVPLTDLAIAQRRRHWQHALRWRADAQKWERAADAVQQWRRAL